MRCCTCPNSRFKMLRNSGCASGLKTAILSMRFMNSGVNLRRAACTLLLDILEVNFSSTSAGLPDPCVEAEFWKHQFAHLACAQVAGHKDHGLREVHATIVPKVSVALSRIPSNRFHSASLAFSISSKRTKLIFTVSV